MALGSLALQVGKSLPALLFCLAAPALAIQVGPATTPVDLSPGGAVLDNGVVRFRFFPNSSLSVPGSGSTALGSIDFDVTDLAGRHVVRHRNRHLWELELVTLPVPGPNVGFLSVTPELATSPVKWTKSDSAGGTELRLIWNGVPVSGDALAENVDVILSVLLPPASPHAVFRLRAVPHLASHAFVSGRLNLSIEAEPDVEEHLLTSLGQLVREPAAVLETEEPLWFDTELRPGSQVSAWYDEGGNGLYLSFNDPVGNLAKRLRYGASPNRKATILEAFGYSVDISDPSLAFEGPPLRVGRFQGDWVDAAELYRDWLMTTPIASQGLLVQREDVPPYLRMLQHAIVLSPLDDYFSPCNEPLLLKAEDTFLTPKKAISATADISSIVPDRITEYANHWGLEHISVLQFSPVWPIGGWEGIGQYTLAPVWQAGAFSMHAAGHHLGFYLYDSWYRTDHLNPVQQTYATEGWSQDTLVELDGTLLVEDHTIQGSGTYEVAMIDPAAIRWQDRLSEVAEALSQVGVDGVFMDNFFPDLTNANFSATNGPPGYGPDHTNGFARCIEVTREAGRKFNPEFTVFSEVMFERFLRVADLHMPEQTSADLVTNDSSTRWVPLRSTVYHHLAVLSPVFAGYYTRPPQTPDPDPPCPGFGDEENSAFATDPAERLDALRGANWTNAYGWVNGSPIWTPDYGATNPKCLVFSFELPEPPPGQVDCFAEYKELCEYAAVLSSLRGTKPYGPFLNLGVRMRDVEWVEPLPTVEVPLTPVFNTEDDLELVPIVAHATWLTPAEGEVAVVLTNHSGDAFAGGAFWFDPAEYGLDPRGVFAAWVMGGPQPFMQAVFDGAQPVLLSAPPLSPGEVAMIRVAKAGLPGTGLTSVDSKPIR